MTSKAEQEEHEKRSEAAKKAAETRAKNKENGENGENGEKQGKGDPSALTGLSGGEGPTGATMTPVQEHTGDVAAKQQPQQPELLPAARPEKEPDKDAKGVAGGNVADDGVEDIELGPPVIGQFVRVIDGEYAGRFAVYLGDVGVIPDDEPVKIIQIRTRDADNLTVDVKYDDVSSTTYSGGR